MSATPIAIVGIGASAGGVEAFTELLSALPADTGLAFVFIQHLAPTRPSSLPEILSRATRMRVVKVNDEPRILGNTVYVLPPDQMLSASNGALHLSAANGNQSRAVDGFLISLAEDQGSRAIGVVLSGTGSDGTLGLEAIKASGGITFAQDHNAKQDAMPRSAIGSGSVDFVLSPEQIAAELISLSAHWRNGRHEIDKEPAAADEFDDVLNVLRQKSGVDFNQYKSNTLHRRIRRRMALHRQATLNDYARFLNENGKEIEALYQDILIGVTSFFRDPAAFEMLKEKVFPGLFHERSHEDVMRIWVLGCATGEECYSLAIALKEYAAQIASPVPLIIYATDLNNVAIEKSRMGLYPKSIALDVSPERLRRFFIETDGGYRVAKSIRDICIFARQNVLTDPPFSRMDFISCRNVLIYMEPSLQKKLMPVLQYALKPHGALFLGPSESLGAQRNSFDIIDSKHKIFRKKPLPPRADIVIPPMPPPHRAEVQSTRRTREPRIDFRVESLREAERPLLARYAPPGVLINREMEILQFRGDTGFYLMPAPGRATLNILKMAREGLLVPLRASLQRVLKDGAAQTEAGVKVKANGQLREIVLTILPVQSGVMQSCFWVLFEESNETQVGTSAPRGTANEGTRSAVSSQELRERDEHIAQLTQELAATREYMRSLIEQQEAAHEELQSATEEVHSANEELQSINEELETSKEEIQSTNEELTTVNDELRNRNEELSRANNDLNNLFGNVQMAMVIVARDLRIRRFTPLAEEMFNLIPGDVGRPISDIRLKIDVSDLPGMLVDVIDNVRLRDIEARDPEGRRYHLRLRPYKTLEHQIDGAVITLINIDAWNESLREKR